MNEEARTKLIRARIAMIVKQPFFGTLALRLMLMENAALNPPTLAVDGKTIFYHPDWVNNNDLDVVMAGVAHEVGHCVFQHIGRRNGREPKRWNYANDYVVNGVLKDSGFTVLPTWLYSAAFNGMSSDEIYELLPPNPPGSSFDGHAEQLPADVDPAINADDWQIATVQAANAAKAAGSLPGSLQRFVDQIVSPKPDWRAVLRRFMSEDSREDYSYARLNRKYASLGIYLPGLYSESMGLLVITVDTSGSISKPIFDAFMAEVDELRNQLQPTMTHLVQCDAEIGEVNEFEMDDEFQSKDIKITGGGGTDFRPPFQWVEKEGIEPKVFLYLTDGYGSFPKQPPPYPVLWLMTTSVVPPWGEHVKIEV